MRFPRQELITALASFPRQWAYFVLALAVIFVASTIGLAAELNYRYTSEVPVSGGALTEGIIGAPRFINPLLATSEADVDLAMLVYSGLLRRQPDGSFIPDLAEAYNISPDGHDWTFTLRPNLVWHDGEPLTAEDIVFTIELAKNPLFKSPVRAAWETVAAAAPDAQTVKLTLAEPNPHFIEALTLGILPEHLWSEVNPETFAVHSFNVTPIGSGPYRIRDIKKNSLDIPEWYELAPNSKFALGEPKLRRLRLAFYPNEEALVSAWESGDITSLAAPSAEAAARLRAAGANIRALALPRIFGVFFNQNRAPIFAQAEVRAALDAAAPRAAVIDTVLAGYGQPATGPLPGAGQPSEALAKEGLDAARQILTDAGWTFGDETGWQKKPKSGTINLAFTLATADTPELKAAAERVVAAWRELGASVELKVYELGDLNQNVIRPRHYDAIFFGEIINRSADLYSFWHSSQRLDPGLNIALYTNANVDRQLENLRQAPDGEAATLAPTIAAAIAKDQPAVFMYSPEFIYVLPTEITSDLPATLRLPAERFTNVYEWYAKTDRVWNIFI